jgi:hypothetical protein
MLLKQLDIKKCIAALIVLNQTLALFCQAPFNRTGQVFVSFQNTQELSEMILNQTNGGPDLKVTYPLTFGSLDAIGYRKTDNLIYGISLNNNHLYQLGSDGMAKDLGNVGLDNTLIYRAGDVFPDGTLLYCIGSDPSTRRDVHLAIIDLTTYVTKFIALSSNSYLADIAFDPISKQLYGFDSPSAQMVKIDGITGFASTFSQLDFSNEIFGLYFDSFGDLYGYGSAVFGIVEALFRIDKYTGREKLLSTGQSLGVNDATSCPYSIEMKIEADPQKTLPCSDLVYTYTIVNASEEDWPGIAFVHTLPKGFYLKEVLSNPFGPVDTLSQLGTLKMNNLSLTAGVKSFKFKIHVGDIPKDDYNSQPVLYNLPPFYGTSSISDNALSPAFEDSTTVNINRYDIDSLSYNWFLCLNETLVLDASEFGNNITWSTGSKANLYEVNKGGVYLLNVASGCEELTITHDVATASCPYTIAVTHTINPDTVFSCSETTYTFVLRNDSAEERFNTTFSFNLPKGFSFKEIGKNPYGGSIEIDTITNTFKLRNMNLKIGIDTLEFVIKTGEVKSGKYYSQGILSGLPILMGPTRFSDDPNTPTIDSTFIIVKGALSDSLALDTVVCESNTIILDAGKYAKNVIWSDSSTNLKYKVDKPGVYELTALDGCVPVKVKWLVGLAPKIDVYHTPFYAIHQGEEVILMPVINNEDDSLTILWIDSLSTTLSCYDCGAPTAKPLESIRYNLIVNNSYCVDSQYIKFVVDQSRRIYYPNIISLNNSSGNSIFHLQSPDYGEVKSFSVYNRWGNKIFSTKNMSLNDAQSGWDAKINDQFLSPGVYVWLAEVEFIDGEKTIYSDDITVIK